MQPNSDRKKQYRMVAFYNMIPSVFWSIVNLTPIFIFCYTLMSVRLTVIFVVVSSISIFLPTSFFNIIMLSKGVSFYKKIGVTIINRFTQNGTIINKLIRKRYPDYKIVTVNKISFNRLLKRTYFFEKFHVNMFIFFSLVTIFAIIQGHMLWAIVLLITNILYNVYPALLQQYLRIRLLSLNKKE